MAETVFIHLPMDASQRVTWTGPGRSAGGGCRHERLGAVSLAAAGARVVAVAPGPDVLVTRVQSPRTSRSNLEKAVPFLLEERLAEPPEHLHVALGRRRDNGDLPVAVVARRVLEQWLDDLREGGIQPEALISEPLLLPWEPGSWTVLLMAERALVRLGREAGFGVEPANLRPALELALAARVDDPPASLRVIDFTAGPETPDLALPGVAVRHERGQGHPLALMAAEHVRGLGINLLQGPFAPVDRWSGAWRHFRLTALLLAVWFLYRGAHGLVEEMQMSGRVEAVNGRIEQTYRAAFPDARRVVDARVQMNQRLNAMRGGGKRNQEGFLHFIGHVSTVLKGGDGTVLQQIRYQQGTLDLFLRVADLQQLDRIKQQLDGIPGLAATIQNANKATDGVDSHLRIGRP